MASLDYAPPARVTTPSILSGLTWLAGKVSSENKEKKKRKYFLDKRMEEEIKDLEQKLEVPQVSFQRDAVAKAIAALLAQVPPPTFSFFFDDL
jgi:hypothetical protein